jgi:hypothetical protein
MFKACTFECLKKEQGKYGLLLMSTDKFGYNYLLNERKSLSFLNCEIRVWKCPLC